MTVTKEMLVAAHSEAMKNGDVILSADLLTRIYKAMRSASRSQITWVCPVCGAPVKTNDEKSATAGEKV
jgi:rubrerythrin